MTKMIHTFSLLFLYCLVGNAQTNARLRPVDYVNPLIGTAPLADPEFIGGNPVQGEEVYTGTVHPGASVPDPNGYLCVGPVSRFEGHGGHMTGSGYRYEDGAVMGFTHFNGEYSDVNRLLFMPTTGAIKTSPGKWPGPPSEWGYRSLKDTLREKASAGYYSVFLSTYDIQAEVTATANCGFHRYTFPASKEANVLIDLANCRPAAKDASVNIIDKRAIEGFQECGRDKIYFRAEFNKDFSKTGTWKDGIITPGSRSGSGTPMGAYVSFNTSNGEAILIKVGTSKISQEDANNNLVREIPGMDFDAVRKQTEILWSTLLNRIVVEGGTEGDRINFYTAHYRMTRGPMYSWFPFYSNPGMIASRGADWVSKRTANIRGSWGGGFFGPGRVSGIVGLYKMGFPFNDLTVIYEKIRNEAMSGGGKAGEAYRQYGYIPANVGVNDYVNRSIALSYDDYALSELAKIVGKPEDHDFFLARSKNYKKLYNASTRFFTPRNADGSWILPLDPAEPHAEDVYREGNAWNYLWFQRGDYAGLAELLGGNDAFIAKLDSFFHGKLTPRVPLRDFTGIIGFYSHGNEQYRNIPYLYNYAGQPWKTQQLVRKIMKELYRPAPAGMCGMDDYGGLEGWLVSSALGFYQSDCASEYYEIGSPLFSKATIRLDGDHPGTFMIEAHHVSDTNKYIQSATLNGKPLNEPRFRQNDMIPGGSLVFEMGPTPNYNWGTGSNFSSGPDIFDLKNKFIEIKVKKTGAELCGIKLLSNGKAYLWEADPKIWGATSPVLFPIVGALKDHSYLLDGKKYSLPNHGFFQRNKGVELVSATDNKLTFKLRYNEKSLEIYPFEFEFLVSYTLEKNKIIVSHEVKNLGSEDMYFSLGAHPSFKCPIDPGEKYSDYYLEFKKPETAYTWQIEKSGLLGGKTDLVLDNSRILPLHYHLFDKDALVFKDIKSTEVSLCSKVSGKRIQVNFKGFPYLGVWAKPNADYICIEPWIGINDPVDTDQNFKTKEGIIKLNGKKSFKASYSISVF